jgi:hypothetical protein
MNKDEIEIVIPKFITHIPKSKNTYIKINGQRIFVGMNHHLRALIVRKIHNYINNFIPDDLVLPQTPLKISLDFYAPINYGNVQMRKGLLVWKTPAKDYTPTWDADNQWIWGKCFNDVLTERGLLVDDNVKYIRSSGEVNFIDVPTLDERKLVFKIKSV